jgi:hypothetical protein
VLRQEQARTAIKKIHKLPGFKKHMREHGNGNGAGPGCVAGFVQREAMKLCPPGASDRMIADRRGWWKAAEEVDAATTANPLEAAAAATAPPAAAATAPTPAEKN